MLPILTEFLIVVLLQALLINGAFESFRGGCVNDMTKGRVCTGNVLYMLNPEWFEKHKHRTWSKPFFSCTKCMASFWGALTFWPYMLIVYGFHWEQLLVYVADVFILVTVNWFIYKKL